MADPIISQFGERVMPLKQMAAWRSFEERHPYMALAMRQRAAMALGFSKPLG